MGLETDSDWSEMVCNRASWSNPIMVGEPIGSMMTALWSRHPGVMKMDLSCGRRESAPSPPSESPRESDEACMTSVGSGKAVE